MIKAMNIDYTPKRMEDSSGEVLSQLSKEADGVSHEAFKRKAREHQVLFRERELGVGFCKYPNVLAMSDARKGLVFFEGFRKEILDKLKEPIPSTSSAPSGQMLTNLLRSEHIPYNVFFPMNKDPEGCRDLFNAILETNVIWKIQDIKIEYHPEPIRDYLNDHTAFDVYISYLDIKGQPCGIGIEVKYTEKEYPLKPNSREYNNVKDADGCTRLSEPYAKATKESGYYRSDVKPDILVSNIFRQIWRNHILGASMVLHGDIAHFTSVTLFPRENAHFSVHAMPAYKKLLTDNAQQTFIPICYDIFFNLMEQYLHVEKKDEWIAYLRRRYLIYK